MIGKIDRVALREVWQHEAQDFTTWLQENVDVLNDVLDLSLSSAERERSAGPFSVDLLAEDDDGNPVVIENQLEKSDHEHLGKLVTYLAALEAKSAVWVVADAAAEHVKTVTWLNEASAASFYLVKIEAIRIGDSPAALLPTLIVGPSEEAREAGQTKKEWAEREVLRYRFWAQLLESASDKTDLYAGISPSHRSWIATGAGKTGLRLGCNIRKDGADAELYIDRGRGTDENNKAIFDQLFSSRDEIDEAVGEPLDWQRLEGKRACRIKKHINLGGYRDDEDKWPEIQEAMIDATIRLERALRPHIDKLDI